MLTLRPTDPLACRGRSRQVPHSARLRHASEERRLVISPMPSPSITRQPSPSPPSSASMSPDCYDSPSPPQSLEDQVHIAYALDDIHLAKILLLRLKGIEVTDDNDPRIAAVQDEDFDFCFVPNGRLLDESDEKAVKELQEKELVRMKEQRRVERLQHCEWKWQEEKRRLREERLAVLRRRERRRLEEEERRRREEEEQRRILEAHERRREEDRRRAARHRARQVVNYDCLRPSSRQSPLHNAQFVYDVMPSTSYKPRTAPRLSPPPVPHAKPHFPTLTFDDSRTVPFADVLRSMRGPLFPPAHDERAPSLCSRSRTRPTKKSHDLDLLASLLGEAPPIDGSPKSTRKHRVQHRRSCLACTLPPTSPLTSSSSLPSPTSTHRSSWLSFRGTPSSASTDITTPSSSPRSSWFITPKSWISTRSGSPHHRHSCHPRTRLTPVSPSDSPLPIDQPTSSVKSHPLCYAGKPRSTSSVTVARVNAGALVRRMSRFVEIAKGFQHSYVSIAIFSIAASHDSFEARHTTLSYAAASTHDWAVGKEGKTSSPAHGRYEGHKLRPAGSRARRVDVAAFLGPPQPSSSDEESAESNLPPPTPLTPPFTPTEPPRTVLPDPLPYKLYFKPIPQPIRSPFRFNALAEMHTTYPSAPSTPHPEQISWRVRFVANPEHLRLKALQNVICQYGLLWEGLARDTALGGAKERVPRIAFDGIGMSWLSR